MNISSMLNDVDDVNIANVANVANDVDIVRQDSEVTFILIVGGESLQQRLTLVGISQSFDIGNSLKNMAEMKANVVFWTAPSFEIQECARIAVNCYGCLKRAILDERLSSKNSTRKGNAMIVDKSNFDCLTKERYSVPFLSNIHSFFKEKMTSSTKTDKSNKHNEQKEPTTHVVFCDYVFIRAVLLTWCNTISVRKIGNGSICVFKRK